MLTKTVDKKIIIIRTNGPIMPKGGVYGPTLAYTESVSEIAVLLRNHYPVYEQLEDGTEVKLTLLNYKDDLNGDEGAAAENLAKPVTEPTPIVNEVKEEVKEEVKQAAVVTPVVTAQKQENVIVKNNTQTASTSNNKADVLTSK